MGELARNCGKRVYRVSVFSVDAQTLDATARLTNIEFTADLQNTSSQAYVNLTESITEEVGVLRGLSSDSISSLNRVVYQS